MIVVNIAGGLANKMFMYAMYMAIREQREDVYVDEASFKASYSFEKMSIKDVFPHIDFPEFQSNYKFWPERKSSRFARLIRKILEKISSNYYCEQSYIYRPSLIKNLPHNCYLRGYWQTEKYFLSIENKVRNAFKFPAFTEPRNLEVSAKMKKENSVSIHIRKGKDYMRPGGTGHGTCTKQYYDDAIQYIKERVDSPVFYIFTDNPDWVKENITTIDYTLVNWNPVSGPTNYRDIQLMSCCKHNIIANSSFSWWGAWLNDNKDKIVIGPKIWFNPENRDQPKDLICDNWIEI